MKTLFELFQDATFVSNIGWALTGLGLIQAILILFKRKENMIFQVLFAITSLFFAIGVRLYADTLEAVITLILAILGSYIWYAKKEKPYSWSTKNQTFIVMGLGFISFVIMYLILKNTNDAMPFFDSISTALGFICAYLMAQNRVDAWIYWFVYDIMGIFIYLNLDGWHFNIVLLNVFWTVLAVATFFTWQKEFKKGQEKITETFNTEPL